MMPPASIADTNVPLNEFLTWKRLLETIPEPDNELKRLILDRMLKLMHTCDDIMSESVKLANKK